MDHRHLWLRSKLQNAILRIRAEIISAVRTYFDGRGFTLVDAPIFTPNACVGTSTLFETEYHGRPAFLTQSGQLYMEAAAAAFGRAYCFGPTFRAEKSKTRRHLSEFWMVEYDDAIAILKKNGIEASIGDDFGGDDETVIASEFDRPVMITHYPMSMKAFYFKRAPGDPSRALCMDVLAPEGYGEIIGGGQREDDLGVLESAIEAHELPKNAFDWYADIRRYGSFPHAGFGLGIERTFHR